MILCAGCFQPGSQRGDGLAAQRGAQLLLRPGPGGAEGAARHAGSRQRRVRYGGKLRVFPVDQSRDQLVGRIEFQIREGGVDPPGKGFPGGAEVPALLQLRLPPGDLPGCLVQLRLGVRQALGRRLPLGGQLRPALFQSCPALVQLPPGFGQFRFGFRLLFGQLLLPRGKLIPPIVQFRSGGVQLLQGFGQLLLRIRPFPPVSIPAFVQLPLGVLDPGKGVRFQAVVPELRPLLQQSGDSGLHSVHGGLIRIRIERSPFRQREEDLGVNLRVEALGRQIDEPGQLALAQGAGPPLEVGVIGRVDQPHHRIGVTGEGAAGFLRVLFGKGQDRAQALLPEVFCVQRALVPRLGQAPGHQVQPVHFLRQQVGAEDDISFFAAAQEIGVHGTDRLRHAGKPCKGVLVLPGEPQGADEPEIVQFLFLKIRVGGLQHGVGGDAKSGEKADPQGNDRKNGEIPGQGTLDFPEDG